MALRLPCMCVSLGYLTPLWLDEKRHEVGKKLPHSVLLKET